jgi:hypothetical protein
MLVALFYLPHSVRADTTATESTLHYVRVAGVAGDQLSLDVEFAGFENCKQPDASTANCRQLHLVIRDMVVKDRLKQLHKGDRITVVYSPDKDQNVLKAFCNDVASGGPEIHTRIWVLIVSFALCLLLYGLFTDFKPHKLMVGKDNRYSNSQFQITVWFFVLISTYIATLWLRVWFAGCEFVGGVNIPENLLLLSGMSVLTFGGAKAITTSKVAAAQAAGNADPKSAANAQPNFLRDLTHSDGDLNAPDPAKRPQLDFGDFQMFVITLIAVGTYLVLVFRFLGSIETSKVVSLPDVDTTILAAFGLGQGAYLTKKAVGAVGQS